MLFDKDIFPNADIVPPTSGFMDVELGQSKVGILQGMCGMGMYPFEVVFKE